MTGSHHCSITKSLAIATNLSSASPILFLPTHRACCLKLLGSLPTQSSETRSVATALALVSGSQRRYTCREIGSYAQAQILLRQGHRYLDGDGDGEACESLRSKQSDHITALCVSERS